jgi:DNA-binding NarL/FixJ family response regulator
MVRLDGREPEVLASAWFGSHRQRARDLIDLLTDRELDVLESFGAVRVNQQIARTCTCPNDGRGYVSRLLVKLGCDNRMEAVVPATKRACDPRG